ncbi:hypothetical protein PoB_004579200 [Plakobranchus ocellatus]|uniref:Uncharacterized protein n=1 Tax=Plakobranchus ocellatus TaxID=259542 RepID=A0AAV4BIR7_9GAST|nr:hypothetical protein PoB_004579200 [Plakobranchus ocellatus]
MEFENRMQIEDDVVDVFNIPVVGQSAVVDLPDGENVGVYVSGRENAVIYVPNGESAVVTLKIQPVENKRSAKGSRSH